MHIKKLKADRAAKVAEAKAIKDAVMSASRPLTDEERQKIDAIKTAVADLDAQIESLEAVAALERTAPSDPVDSDSASSSSTNPGPSPGTFPDNASLSGGAPAADSDPCRGFRAYSQHGVGEFLHSVIQAGRQGTARPYINGRQDERLVPLRAAAGSDEQHGGSQQFGGFTVPEGFSGRLMSLEMEDDPTAGTTDVPMDAPSVKIPARVDKNHTSSVAGGITVAWSPPTASISSSRMSMEQVELSADSLKGIAYVEENLLEDSAISWAAILEAGFRDAVADAIIRARIDGTGVGEPLGILNSPALASVSTTNQTTGTITAANILAMRQRVWRYSRAVWLANHDTYVQLASATIAHANSDTPIFHPARGTDVPDTLLGRPIVFTEYAKALTTQGDIMCCVWSEYLVGLRSGIRMAESMHVRFENNERALRITMRQAGAPWWRSALTPVNGANTLSPFVALDTRTT